MIWFSFVLLSGKRNKCGLDKSVSAFNNDNNEIIKKIMNRKKNTQKIVGTVCDYYNIV